LDRQYGGDKSKVPSMEYLGVNSAPIPVPTIPADGVFKHPLGQNLPETTTWLETLAGQELNWLRALITSSTIVRGTSYVNNPIRRLLVPRRGQEVHVDYENKTPTSVTIYGAARSHGTHNPSFKAVEIKYSPSSRIIDLTIFEHRRDVSVPLFLQFKYEPSMGYAPIHEIAEGRNTRIKQFYWKLWYGDDSELPLINVKETFVGPEVTIEADAVETFCAIVGNQDQSFKVARNSQVKAPMDFAIVTGWQVRTVDLNFQQKAS
jgi:fatty acid synthase subunit alpha, fungi type